MLRVSNRHRELSLGGVSGVFDLTHFWLFAVCLLPWFLNEEPSMVLLFGPSLLFVIVEEASSKYYN